MIPSLQQAENLLEEASLLNPGPWTAHSRGVAQAARAIATAHPRLDPEKAYILGLLHDIGRREGVTDNRHSLDGYRYLTSLGFTEAGRICLTHSFQVKRIDCIAGTWDCSADDQTFAQTYLDSITYDDYDRLIQLCDCLALPEGFCLIEKRMVDVALRHGFNACTLEKWRAILQIREDLEGDLGVSIYQLLPGVVENTFPNRTSIL